MLQGTSVTINATVIANTGATSAPVPKPDDQEPDSDDNREEQVCAADECVESRKEPQTQSSKSFGMIADKG